MSDHHSTIECIVNGVLHYQLLRVFKSVQFIISHIGIRLVCLMKQLPKQHWFDKVRWITDFLFTY